MSLITYTDHLFPGVIKSFGHQDPDGLFAVTMWSVVGVALTVLTIWLGLGGQIEPLIGLGL